GWSAFRKLVGGDQAARDLFALMYRAEPALLEAVEKEPQALAARVKSRCQQLVNRLYTTNGKQPEPPAPGEVMALLFAAAATPTTPDLSTFYSYINLLHNQTVRTAVQHSPAMR